MSPLTTGRHGIRHMHDSDDIDTVVVGARVVAVHGLSNTFWFVGTAPRHGEVVAELNAMMRKARDI
jgi:hypothetical protein